MVSIVSAARDLGRIREVSTVLFRHGFGEIALRLGLGGRKESKAKEESEALPHSPPKVDSGTVARRIRAVLEDLGPSFVKLGQLASTRPDLLPKEVIFELKKLQDSVGQVSFAEIREQMASTLGAPLEDLFESITETPLAAGSIAQVHRAKLKSEDGPVDVVVKVQRPGIAATIASDLDILHMLAALLERAIPETKIYSPAGLVDQFDQAITAELDFVQEGENARRFRQNFADHPEVVFPTVYRDASSKQVITLSFLEGDKFEDALKKGHDGKALAKLTFRTMVKQIYEDGFFHADPHPGNVLIQGTPEAPRLALFDLGMVGRMSPRMRDLTIDVVTAALRRDTDAMAMALYEIGTPTKKIDMEAYKLEVALLSEKLLGRSLGEVDVGELLRDLVRTATKYGITIPTDFLLMGKALVTIEGVGKEIDPDFDLMEEAQPLFADLLRKRYSPERIGTDLWRRLERLGGVGYRVPQQLEEVLEDVRLGRLTVTTQSPEHARALGRASRHLASGVVVAALTVGAALLFAVRRDELAWIFVGVSALSTSYQMLAGVWSHFGKS